jgi:branched-chain amino acid transport system substrate-binding protein
MHLKSFSQVLLLSFSLLFLSCQKEATPEKKKVSIGALLSLSGNWSSLGQTSKAAIEQAITDINGYLQTRGANYEFSAVVYDTKLDTAIALKSVKEASAAGTKYFIGPQSSAELGAIREYVNTNKLLVVSQGSTASSLAISNDGIFRFCPGDSIEGAAVAVSIRSLGCQNLITIARDDAGNKGLQRSVASKFAAMGGTATSLTPYSTTQTDFSSLLATLKPILQSAITSVGASKVGIYLGSFDECVQLFQQAAADPIFSSVRWYGGDGVVLSAAVTANAQAASFAAATKFFAPTFGLPMQPHADLARVVSYIKSKSGIEPDAYAISAYDATWVIANSIINYQTTPQSFTDFLNVFIQESKRFYGLSGPLQLNDAGDRSNGSFDYWGIELQNGSYAWKWVGKSQ